MATGGVITVDLNADAGESFGRWAVADEAALFPQLSSVNLACGFHAGDPLGLLRSIDLAATHGVAVGAHPGFPDLAGFGRREMRLSDAELEADTLYQLSALDGLLRVRGLRMHHVKAHGALYLQMMRDARVTAVFARAVTRFDPQLPVVLLAGPGGEVMRSAAEAAGAHVVAEAFPDRAYLGDGRLAGRDTPGALIHDPGLIAERAVALATGRPLAAADGDEVTISCQTLCIHGDSASAPAAARAVRQALAAAGVAVCAF